MLPVSLSIRSAALGVALLGCAFAAPADAADAARTITVSASGSVAAEPDQARVSSGVAADGATAREALDKNSAAMRKVIDELKSAGIDPKDIRTSGLRVEPRYTRPMEGQAPAIDGYSVSNTVEVLVRDVEKVGAILDRLVTAGANQVAGLSFEVSQAETLLDEARKQAVANARRRAELYAAAADAEVGDVLTIVEGDVAQPPRPMFARAMKADGVPVERGTQTLEASVTITWALE